MGDKIQKAIDEQGQGVGRDMKSIERPDAIDGNEFFQKVALDNEYVALTGGSSVNDAHPMMEPEFFQELQRENNVNNKILIMVRHKSSGIMNYLTMVDICKYDTEERKIINTNAIPIFYRDMYKGLFGRTDYIFYANRKDLPLIKSMLMAEKKTIKKADEEMNDFLAGIDSGKEVSTQAILRKELSLDKVDPEVAKVDKAVEKAEKAKKAKEAKAEKARKAKEAKVAESKEAGTEGENLAKDDNMVDSVDDKVNNKELEKLNA